MDDNNGLLACIEACLESWSNCLMVTELWITDSLQKQGYGKLDNVKEVARGQRKRVLIIFIGISSEGVLYEGN